jgi:hypothetical protein
VQLGIGFIRPSVSVNSYKGFARLRLTLALRIQKQCAAHRQKASTMFANPFNSASTADTLGQHVFGRFAVRTAPAGAADSATPPVVEGAASATAGDEFPDLAQRVREVGEW